ncbi:hypothetical protein ACVOMV_24905 [Mesorhizobium atlanticum]
MAELHEQVAMIAETAVKLLRETERLRRDVATIRQRLTPSVSNAPEETFRTYPKVRNLKDALNLLDLARRSLVAIELDTGRMRSALDTAEAAAVPREEMKPWLKEGR